MGMSSASSSSVQCIRANQQQHSANHLALQPAACLLPSHRPPTSNLHHPSLPSKLT